MKKSKILSLFAATFLVGTTASHAAVVLVAYDFQSNLTPTAGANVSYPVSTLPPENVTATSITEGAGATPTGRTSTGELNLLVNTGSATTAAGAVLGNQFVEFTLNTPSADFGLDLDTLTFNISIPSTAGSTRSTFLRTSLDTFATNKPVNPDNGSSTSDGIFEAQSGLTSTLLTFTFPNTPLFNNQDGPVTFRIYTFNSAGTNRSIVVDNVTVNGSVIPEPTSIAMLLGGFGTLLMLRRRRA